MKWFLTILLLGSLYGQGFGYNYIDPCNQQAVNLNYTTETTANGFLVTYYNPMWGSRGLNRGVYAQDKKYKLYKNGSFFDYLNDPYEREKINLEYLSHREKEIFNKLQKSLDTVPDLPKINHNNWKERLREVRQSGKFDSNWKVIK